MPQTAKALRERANKLSESTNRAISKAAADADRAKEAVKLMSAKLDLSILKMSEMTAKVEHDESLSAAIAAASTTLMETAKANAALAKRAA